MPHPPAANDRVTVAGRLVAREGAAAELLALFAELIEHVQAHEPGTERYLVLQNDANPSELWLHEVYQDEAAFVAHGHSPVVRGLVNRMAPLVAERNLARTRILAGIDRSGRAA
ncbi:MAG: antibiotic biosynthesis monooxygenase [Actinobacteria bacterium]|nr:antibiotic biosynthesis monooxygenase [Actinomycetota bacterium]